MKKEYDLMYELGRGNWIDAIAGEAVVLGFVLRDPILEVKGTELATLITKIKYDNDEFFKVEACVKSLEQELSRVKSERKQAIFIDSVGNGENRPWPAKPWEYEFIFVGGKYQIWMNLPVYQDKTVLSDTEKVAVEMAVRQFVTDPSLENYQYHHEETVCQSQTFRVMRWTDADGEVIRHIINHDHADNLGKGWLEKFYFDDFGIAVEAWKSARDVVTSDRK